MHLPPFPGFTPEGLAFLRDLRAHNERDWFGPRKPVYEDELRFPMMCFVAQFAAEARRRGLPLTGTPEHNLFRIYRDTRFSKDKRPYKTHVSCWLTPSGRREEDGGLYVHVEPDNVFLGAGYWLPQAPLLRRIRTRLADDPGLGPDLTARLSAHGLAFESDEQLKRLPQGFQDHADSEAAPFLKWKSFLAMQRLPDAAVLTPAFVDTALTFAEAARPVLDLGVSG
jgi:uncharacterized protein (TIGR02453 family)